MVKLARAQRLRGKSPEPLQRYQHAVIEAMANAVRETAQSRGLTRERGGRAREVYWVEMSGRHTPAGEWYEMRLHYDPVGMKAQAGLLGYQPLTRGGETIEVGRTEQGDVLTPEAARPVTDQALRWLEMIEPLDPHIVKARIEQDARKRGG